MKRKIIYATSLFSIAAASVSLTSCGERKDGLPSNAENPVILTETKVGNEVIGGVLDLGTYDSFDEDAALEEMKQRYGKNIVEKAGCTAVVKDRTDRNEGLLIGRNMDFSLSNKPLYKYQLNYSKYKTIGITYSSKTGPDFEVAKKGSSIEANKEMFKFLPCIGSDFLNEKGLYIETDMRNLDYGTDPYTSFNPSKYGCTGTNPGKKPVFLTCVPFYVSTRCETVQEVLDMMRNDINIFNSVTTEAEFKEKGLGLDWNFCFECADKLGNYGLIEIAKNQIFYTPKCGQTNFYRNDVLASVENFPTGGWSRKTPGAPEGALGATLSCEEYENGGYGPFKDDRKSRYAVATEGLDNVTTVNDMLENMRKVYYSQAYADQELGINAAINKYYKSLFNPRYELVQCMPLVEDPTVLNPKDAWKLDFEKGNPYKCTFKVLTELSTEKFTSLFKEYINHYYTGKTKAKLLEDKDDYWVTSHTIVTDIEAGTWTATFFEGNKSFTFTVE